MNKISLCFIHAYPSLSEGLSRLNGVSRSQQLKRGLKKQLLNSKVLPKSEYSLPIDIVNIGMINPNYIGPNPEVLEQSNDIISIEKPSGVHCHPLRYDESDNLLSWLRSQGYSELLQINNHQYDRGLLYRLDFETSGLVLMAKSDEVYQNVRDEFNTLTKQKIYFAKISGVFEKAKTLTHRIKPSGSKGHKMTEASDGVEAVIQVEPVFIRDCYTVVKVLLGQGHRHQIRAQLSLAGFPIVGDELYGGEKAQRLFLHCYQYEIGAYGVFRTTEPSWCIP